METQVRVLGRSDAAAIFELRRMSYLTSRDLSFVASEECLTWSSEDEASRVLGVFDDSGQLVATMRGQILHHRDELARQAGLAPTIPELFPTLYLSRAATRSERACSGLNSLLRLHFLRYALDEGVLSLSGSITERSVRSRTLRELGYEFYEQSQDDHGLMAKTGPWRLVVLDLNRDGQSALAQLRAMHEGSIRAAKTAFSVSARPRA